MHESGTVTYTQQRGDDGRYTGQSNTFYFTIELPENVTQWLGRWPPSTIPLL